VADAAVAAVQHCCYPGAPASHCCWLLPLATAATIWFCLLLLRLLVLLLVLLLPS
jgi:hypothetical protein